MLSLCMQVVCVWRGGGGGGGDGDGERGLGG